MESAIKNATAMKHEPVAIIMTDDLPADAKQFKAGKWGCVMWMMVSSTRGKTAAFDKETFGCFGGGVGLGFGNQYKNFPGGEDCFCYFLSTGNEQWEQGKKTGEQVRQFMRDEAYEDFMFGEGYVKTPDLVQKFIACLPIMDIEAEYVVFKPLSEVDPEKETPTVVVFLCDMDQLSALTVLANYDRETNDNVIIPYAAGCQTIGIYPFAEASSENPRGVVGMTDLSARVNVKRMLGDDVMTFAAPYKLYQEMEKNVPGSFLERSTWKKLMELKG